MATWTDKDTFKLVHYKTETYFHALNDLNGTIRALATKNDKRFKNIEF